MRRVGLALNLLTLAPTFSYAFLVGDGSPAVEMFRCTLIAAFVGACVLIAGAQREAKAG